MNPIGQFTNGHRYTTGPKVIAAQNGARHVRVAEEPLNFPFFNRIPLLYFRAGSFQRVFCVGF